MLLGGFGGTPSRPRRSPRLARGAGCVGGDVRDSSGPADGRLLDNNNDDQEGDGAGGVVDVGNVDQGASGQQTPRAVTRHMSVLYRAAASVILAEGAPRPVRPASQRTRIANPKP